MQQSSLPGSGEHAFADDVTAGLNPEQSEAVRTTEGPLLVLAGAGSGKTRVLTHRIAHLIGGCGIPPESILAVTFTNKAAGEMRERVEKLLGPVAEGLWCGTFHSTCVRILRRDIGHLGRSRGFVIYDEADSLATIKEALRRHGHDPKKADPKRFRWRIDQWKNAGWLPAHALEYANDVDDELCAEIYATYQRLLTDANALDFNDLLLQTVDLFKRTPEVLGHYQRRWQYVMVDEYQDTNKVQYELVRLLAEAHGNICVVGDPDQSIYAWRGADIRNILDFERDYEGARVIKLERNYRSTQPILSGATAVVANNVDRKEKAMFTEREGGEKIHFFEASDDREEAQYVVGQILQAGRDGERSLGDIAILYRTNAQSRPFEEELLKYDLPYTIVGGTRFYDRMEVKDALAYLRLLVNPTDDAALRRIVNKPARGIGKTTIERAEVIAARERLPLLEAFRFAGRHGELGRSTAKVGAFLQMMDALRHEVLGQRIDEAVARVLDRSGYLRSLEAEDTPEAETRIENLKELLSSAQDFHAANAGQPIAPDQEGEERSEIELFLDQVALISDLDSYDQARDRISLMTAHSAKGLEFPCVFLVGLEEGIFPHASSSRSEEGVEEERRLVYVAMTRAMERLVITAAMERRRFGELSFQTPSRFLEEVPAELLEVSRSTLSRGGRAGGYRSRASSGASGGRRGAYRRGESSASGDSSYDDFDQSPSTDYSYSQEPAAEGGVSRGQRVRHPVFGAGSVVSVTGSGLDQKLKINFDKAGVKTVMVRYANLEPA